MCRLLGISMGDKYEDIDIGQIAALMFKALTAGGPHAFGWMNWSDGDESVQYQNRQGRADTLDNLEYVYDSVQRQARWFVGHTRWATHGTPSNPANNHPILHHNILGVHNGVLRNHNSILKETGRMDDTAEVDSEAIFAAVNKWGAVEGIRKVEGDMVSIWTDLNDMSTIYIARSEGRYLHLGWTDRGNLVFASQPDAIEALHPLVRIVKWSSVEREKLIKIKNGKIITRTKIREPRPLTVVPSHSSNVQALGATTTVEFFGARGVAAQKRGSRRGKAMFPQTTIQEDVDAEVAAARAEFERISKDKSLTDEERAAKFAATVDTIGTGKTNQNGSPRTTPRKETKKKGASKTVAPPKVNGTKPKTKTTRTAEGVVTERWVPELGMFADDDGNLRPASQAEADFFGYAVDAETQSVECENVFDWTPKSDDDEDDPTLEWEGEGNPLTEA